MAQSYLPVRNSDPLMQLRRSENSLGNRILGITECLCDPDRNEGGVPSSVPPSLISEETSATGWQSGLRLVGSGCMPSHFPLPCSVYLIVG